jgi:hypothetical protein
MEILKNKKFGFDEGPDFLGWTQGDFWNGWGMPYFDLETTIKVLEMLHVQGVMVARYEPENGRCLVSDLSNGESCELEYIHAYPHMTTEGEKLLFNFGNLGWTWNQMELEEGKPDPYLYPLPPSKPCLKNIGTGHFHEAQTGYDVKPAPVGKEVCESCLYAAQDEGAEDREMQITACLTFGADMADHECDAEEVRASYGQENYVCHCECNKPRTLL